LVWGDNTNYDYPPDHPHNLNRPDTRTELEQDWQRQYEAQKRWREEFEFNRKINGDVEFGDNSCSPVDWTDPPLQDVYPEALIPIIKGGQVVNQGWKSLPKSNKDYIKCHLLGLLACDPATGNWSPSKDSTDLLNKTRQQIEQGLRNSSMPPKKSLIKK